MKRDQGARVFCHADEWYSYFLSHVDILGECAGHRGMKIH